MKRSRWWLVLLMLCSCTLEPDLSFETIDEVVQYVADTVEYVSDADAYYPLTSYWQTPEETQELGAGDCEDSVLYAMRLIYDHLGIRTQLRGGYRDNAPHAWLIYDGQEWEVLTGEEITGDPLYTGVLTLGYMKAMLIARGDT